MPGQLPAFKIGQIYPAKTVVLNTITLQDFSKFLLLYGGRGRR